MARRTRFVCKFDCGNAAFIPKPGDEIGRILREIARSVEDDDTDTKAHAIRDINGNLIGSYQFIE